MMADVVDGQRPCAVVTGGAGLLGQAMGLAFARQGMDVVLADIDAEKVEAAAEAVRATGVEVLAVRCDVAQAAEVDELAARAYARFGRVNRLCLNAGLAILKPFAELRREDWNAVMGVQFGGVLNGVLAFLPRLIAQGGDRHVVLTSSMSGVGRADLRTLNAPYVVAKFATTGLGEVMGPALEEHGIGVSILCPGLTVKDPEAMRGMDWPMASAKWYADNVLDAEQVAAEVLAGISEGRRHIFPHHAGRQEAVDRHAMLMRGFDQAEAG